MTRREKRRNRPVARKGRPPRQHWREVLLDRFTLADLRRWQRLRDDGLAYEWEYYSCLLHQRRRVAGDLRNALVLAAAGPPLVIENWCRVVDYQFSNHPLSTRGSVLADPGGRFNIGDIDGEKFPSFPALYVAEDPDTALAEKFGFVPPDAEPLLATELNLREAGSFSLVRVAGSLETVIDLRASEALRTFVDLIRTFEVPASLSDEARRVGLNPPDLIDSPEKLVGALEDPDWRVRPMQFDVPSTPQVFGQLVREAGIEGIVYVSSKNRKLCVAVFPNNLSDSSFIALVDPIPSTVEHTRLDSTGWRKFA